MRTRWCWRLTRNKVNSKQPNVKRPDFFGAFLRLNTPLQSDPYVKLVSAARLLICDWCIQRGKVMKNIIPAALKQNAKSPSPVPWYVRLHLDVAGKIRRRRRP